MAQLLFTYLVLFLEIVFIHTHYKVTIRRNIYFYFILPQFFFFAAFRALQIAPDTLSYAAHFANVSFNGYFWDPEKDIYNYGYLIFEKFIHNNVTSSILGYDIITSAIFCFCTFWLFYKRALHMGVALFLYYASGEYFTQMAIMRESLAVMVSYYCFYCFEKKRFLLSVPFILISISFHNSAILLFFILFLKWYSPSFKTRTWIFISTVIISYAIAPFMEMILNLLAFETKYFEEGVDNGFSTVNSLFNGSVGLLVSFFVYKMIKNCKGNNDSQYIHYMEYLYVYFLISIVTLRLSILSRYLMLLNPFIFILVSNLAFVTRKNYKYALFTLLVFSGNIIVKIIFRPDWIGIFPYSFYDNNQLNYLPY